MAKKNYNSDEDRPAIKPDYSNLPDPLRGWKTGHDYLTQSAALHGNSRNPRDKEVMQVVSEAILAGKPAPAPGLEAKAPPNVDAEDRRTAKLWADQGWAPHHETGEARPVESFEEALIIARYARRSREAQPLDELPFMLKFETEEQQASMDKWLGGDKSTQSPKGGPNPHSFEAKSYASPGFSGLNYNTMSVDDD